MPILAKVPLALSMNRSGGYDNRLPRLQQNSLSGFGARAMAAHQNCFEAITFFAPTVLVVLALNAVTQTTAYLCIVFVLCRLVYLVCYWLDYHVARSVFWAIGTVTIIAHYGILLSVLI